MPPPPLAATDLRAAIAEHPVWYHTLELAPGVETPGWFDLRPIVDRLPWPDVRGKRCLDVGTYDGYLAFELERRGAAEVVALDVPDHADWDWPPDMRARGPQGIALVAGPTKGAGFRLAKEALGSSVEKVDMTVYELEPERVGTFDVVVCGSLLLHLRDPLRALEAIRGVCDGHLMSAEEVRLSLTLLHPRRALAELNGSGEQLQWWVPNAAGHRRMVFAAGFGIERSTRPYSIPFGSGHPGGGWHLDRESLRLGLGRLLATGRNGNPHAALLARPRI